MNGISTVTVAEAYVFAVPTRYGRRGVSFSHMALKPGSGLVCHRNVSRHPDVWSANQSSGRRIKLLLLSWRTFGHDEPDTNPELPRIPHPVPLGDIRDSRSVVLGQLAKVVAGT